MPNFNVTLEGAKNLCHQQHCVYSPQRAYVQLPTCTNAAHVGAGGLLLLARLAQT